MDGCSVRVCLSGVVCFVFHSFHFVSSSWMYVVYLKCVCVCVRVRVRAICV